MDIEVNDAPIEVGQEAGDVDTIDTEIQEAEVSVAQDEVQEIVAPDDWEDEIKNHLNGFGEDMEAKKAFFERHSNFTKGYSKKFTELDEQRKSFEQERESFEDVRSLSQNFKALEETCRGVNSDVYNREVARLGGANNYFAGLHQVSAMLENPQTRLQAISNIMESYQITPQMIYNGQNDPQYQAMLKEQQYNQSMEQQLSKFREELKAEQEAKEADMLINNFVSSKDEQGNLVYPHFEQVREQMAVELEARGIHSPTAEDLASSYQNACYANPTLRAELIQAEIQAQAMQQAQSTAKANEIKKAENVIGVKAQSKPVVNKKSGWESVLKEQLDSIPEDD